MTKKFSGVSKTVFLFLLNVLLSVSSSGAGELDVSVGFGHRFRSGFWSPVTVFIRGDDSPVDGMLSVIFQQGTLLEEGEKFVLKRPVRTEGRELRIQRFVLPLRVGSHPLEVRLEEEHREPTVVKLPLRELSTDNPLIVGISRRPSLDGLLLDLSRSYGRRVELVYPHVESLPESAAAWEGVGLVILHDMPPNRLDGAAARALADWVSLGGMLVMIGGPWLSGRSPPGGLPPRTIGPPALTAGGTMMFPPEDEGRIAAAGPGGEALLHHFPHGRGMVWYLPYDAVSSSESLRSVSWGPIFRTVSDEFDEISLPSAAAIADAMEEENLIFPPRYEVLTILLTFIILASVIMFFRAPFSGIAERLTRVGMLLVLTAAVSVVIVQRYQGKILRTDLMLKRVSVLTQTSARTAWLEEALTLVSSRPAMVNLTHPGGILRVLSREGGDLTMLKDERGVTLEDLKLEPWAPRTLVLTSKAVVLDLSVSGKGEGLRIVNHSERDLVNLMLVWKEKIIPLGRVAAGEILKKDISGPSGGWDSTPPAEMLQQSVMDSPMLFAEIENPGQRTVSDRSWVREYEHSFFIMPVEGFDDED